MLEQWVVTVPKPLGQTPRRVYVYIPDDFKTDPTAKYPVLYMFDGQNLFYDEQATFGTCWGLKDYLEETQTPVIVVGVECDPVGNGRLSEYSPINFTMKGVDGVIKGKGKRYMDWLVKEFKPYIDSHYPTLPDRANTAIAGSSLGGLMTIYALAKYGRYFSKGAGLSPSLWLTEEDIYPFIRQAKWHKDTQLYLDYGTKEWRNHATQKQAFAKTCAYLTEQDVCVTSHIALGGAHCEASWRTRIPLFMPILGFTPQNK